MEATAPPAAESRPPQANTPSTTDPGRAALVERANAGDPTAIVEVIRRFEPRIDGPPFGHAKLRLRRPYRSIFRHLPRRLSEVDPELCELFAKLAAGDAPWPLLIHGPVGSGKSFAALCFADLIPSARYSTLETLCNSIMAGDPMPWRDAGELLVVDELGERSKVGDLHYTALKNTLDYREWHHRRVAIYVSNLSPADLCNLFDDRIASRLTAGSVFKLEAADRRQ